LVLWCFSRSQSLLRWGWLIICACGCVRLFFCTCCFQACTDIECRVQFHAVYTVITVPVVTDCPWHAHSTHNCSWLREYQCVRVIGNWDSWLVAVVCVAGAWSEIGSMHWVNWLLIVLLALLAAHFRSLGAVIVSASLWLFCGPVRLWFSTVV